MVSTRREDHDRAPRSGFFATVIQQHPADEHNHLDYAHHVPVVPSNGPRPTVTNDELEYYDPRTRTYGTCTPVQQAPPPPPRAQDPVPRHAVTPAPNPEPRSVSRRSATTSNTTSTKVPPSAKPPARPKPVPKAKRDLLAKKQASSVSAPSAPASSSAKAKAADPESESEEEEDSNKRKRGGREKGARNYKSDEVFKLLRAVRKREPYGQLGWKDVTEDYNAWAKKNGKMERNLKSLSGKFFKVCCSVLLEFIRILTL